QDVWATVLYLIGLAAFIYACVVGFPPALAQIQQGIWPGSTQGAAGSAPSWIRLLYPLAVVIVAALVFAMAFFYLMRSYPRQMIKVAYWVSAAYLILFGIFLLGVRSWIFGGLMILLGLLYALAYRAMLFKVPFATVMLQLTTSISRQFPATQWIGFLATLLTLAFQIVWYIALLGLFNVFYSNSAQPGATVWVILVFMGKFFFLYWTQEVVKNTVHVTIAGLYATVYFTGTSTGDALAFHVPVSNPTLKSARRALTTSFGSICFGSLLIAIIQTLRFLARMAQNESAREGNWLLCLLACCLNCILACLEDMLNYFNHYAFTQVAIYGKDYCTAGKDTWNLFLNRGIEAIINDNLIDNVILMGGISAGFIGALVGFLVVFLDSLVASTVESYLLYCIIGFVLSFSCFMSMLRVITSGVSTTFVCLAEDPGTMERLKPELFQIMAETWPAVQWRV
ncbi:plasma-membrane choline transporter-domain-containing protein, partial [Polychytrium aggregatum]|uniref:plasma-membrane choline transporter-domain-containing protein n=1 Tax=Polychytrium aggregatum TaxID=110093 RepID=UPI0022FEDB85